MNDVTPPTTEHSRKAGRWLIVPLLIMALAVVAIIIAYASSAPSDLAFEIRASANDDGSLATLTVNDRQFGDCRVATDHILQAISRRTKSANPNEVYSKYSLAITCDQQLAVKHAVELLVEIDAMEKTIAERNPNPYRHSELTKLIAAGPNERIHSIAIFGLGGPESIAPEKEQNPPIRIQIPKEADSPVLIDYQGNAPSEFTEDLLNMATHSYFGPDEAPRALWNQIHCDPATDFGRLHGVLETIATRRTDSSGRHHPLIESFVVIVDSKLKISATAEMRRSKNR